MQIFDSYKQAEKKLDQCVLTIGNFDGVHLGHRELIKKTIQSAKRHKVPAVLLTFSPHPAQVLSHKTVKLLMLDEQKKQKFAELGLDAAIFQAFTLDFSQMTAEEFAEEILINSLQVCEVIVGEDFRFGFKGNGDVAFLRKYLESKNRSIEIVDHVKVANEVLLF